MDFLTQYFSDTFLYALGWTMIHSLWQGTLIAVLLALAMMQLEKRSAKIRYEVACSFLFMTFIISLATFIFYLEAGYETAQTVIAISGTSGSTALTLPGNETSAFQQIMETLTTYFDGHLSLIVNIWGLGFIFFTLRMAGGLFHLRKLRRQETFSANTMWQRKFQELLHRVPLQRPVQLLESGLVKVPLMLGHLKPLILIPVCTINSLTEEEAEAILAHELAHIIRQDFLINLFFTFVETLFYYHPGVWLMAATIRSERENCCDDIALKLCKNPVNYARALYKLEEAHRTNRLPGLALSFSGNKKQLLHRVRRILNKKQNKNNVMEKLTATGFLMITIVLLSIGATTPLDRVATHRTLTTTIKTLENPTVFVEASTPVKLNLPNLIVRLDTVPVKRKERQRIIKTENGRSVELTVEDTQLRELIIDGVVIPAEEYNDYQDLITEVVFELDNIPPAPPAPPAPPTPPDAPEAPEAPEAPKVRVHNVEGTTRVVFMTDEKGEEKEIKIAEMEMEVEADGKVNKRAITVYETMEDAELHRANMKKHEKEMEKHHKKMEEHQQEMEKIHKERKNENMEEHRQRMDAHRQKMDEKRAEMEAKRMKMRERHQQMAEERKIAAEEREERTGEIRQVSVDNVGRFDNDINDALEAKLLEDGLIQDRENYKLELSGKQLKVNGKKQSDEVYEKYKALYKEISGHPISDQSKIKIKRRSN